MEYFVLIKVEDPCTNEIFPHYILRYVFSPLDTVLGPRANFFGEMLFTFVNEAWSYSSYEEPKHPS